MRGLGILAGMGALLAGPALATPHHKGGTRYPVGQKPNSNRYTPHQGEREVARRLRQQKRDRERQQLRHPMGVNCGLSRRGRLVQH